MPTISIIVPVYNAEEYLHRCIDSILSQTFIDFELLLIDDGSTDSSSSICDEYVLKDSRIRVFHKKNGGASSARNLGLDKCQGQWVAFCDSDDWVYPNWLENFRDNFMNVDYVCQGIETTAPLTIKSDLNHYRYGISYLGSICPGIEVMHNNSILGYTVISLFKRQIIEDNSLRFNVMYNLHEDLDFVLRYLGHCKYMRCVKNIGYYYYVPKFGEKYIIKNEYSLRESLYLNLRCITGDNYSKLEEHFLYLWVDCFIKTFRLRSFRDKVLFMKQFKRNIKCDILNSQLFLITRWFIYLDPTAFFSSIILTIHLYLKS